MNVMKIRLSIIGLTLLTAAGAAASPVVRVENNTKGKVKFSVDVDFGGENDMWVDPGTSKEYDSNGLRLNEVKIRYYPADGSSMLSWDHSSIPIDQDYLGWGWIYTIKDDSIEYGASTTTLTELVGSTENVKESTDYYYWPIKLLNQTPYIAIAAWGNNGTTDFAVIEPNEETTVKPGSIKLFEKREGNPVALKKDNLNKKTLEINGSESKGFSLLGSGNSTGHDSGRTYKNNTSQWVTYDYKKNANDWRILRGSDAQGHSEADKNASVRIYTKQKKTLYLSGSDHYSWIIDAKSELKAAE